MRGVRMFRHFLGLVLVLGLTWGCGEEEPSGKSNQGDSSEDDTAVEIELEGDDAGECADGADNDLDGLFDCDDPDCGPAPDCQEAGGANLEPSQPVVEITPADAASADDLTCAITLASTDPEGGTVSYLYTWEVDGVDSGITSETVMARFTDGEEKKPPGRSEYPCPEHGARSVHDHDLPPQSNPYLRGFHVSPD